MKLNLTKIEQRVISNLNKYSYYIDLNEKNNDPLNHQEGNLSGLLYNCQLIIDLFKARGVYVGDNSDTIRTKLTK